MDGNLEKQVFMNENKVIGEEIYICKYNFRFQFYLKSCITKLRTRKYRDAKEMKDVIKDMEQNPQDIFALRSFKMKAK